MPYTVRPVKGPDDELPELKVKEHVKRNAPRTMSRPPFLMGMFGGRGSGKTTLLIKLIRWYDSVNAFDKIVIFSPTHEKDPKWEALHNSGLNAQLEMFTSFDHKRFGDFTREQDDKLNRYEKYLVAIEAYKKFKKRQGKTDSLSEEELLSLYEYDFSDPRDFEEFKHGRPSVFIAFDDQVGNTDVYRGDCKGPVAIFAFRHRHYNCSVCFMAQVYKTGIPNGIRNNLSTAVFFANKSNKIKLEAAEEMCAFVTPEQFVDMWTYATESDDHGSFMITFDAERPEWRFRKNLDTLLMPHGNAEDEDEDASPVLEEGSTEEDSNILSGKDRKQDSLTRQKKKRKV